jgi:hypothetical protein
MEVVKEEAHETLCDDRSRGSRSLSSLFRLRRLRRGRGARGGFGTGRHDLEPGYLLRLSIVKEPEVFLMEVADRPALGIANHHPHHH